MEWLQLYLIVRILFCYDINNNVFLSHQIGKMIAKTIAMWKLIVHIKWDQTLVSCRHFYRSWQLHVLVLHRVFKSRVYIAIWYFVVYCSGFFFKEICNKHVSRVIVWGRKPQTVNRRLFEEFGWWVVRQISYLCVGILAIFYCHYIFAIH